MDKNGQSIELVGVIKMFREHEVWVNGLDEVGEEIIQIGMILWQLDNFEDFR